MFDFMYIQVVVMHYRYPYSIILSTVLQGFFHQQYRLAVNTEPHKQEKTSDQPNMNWMNWMMCSPFNPMVICNSLYMYKV